LKIISGVKWLNVIPNKFLFYPEAIFDFSQNDGEITPLENELSEKNNAPRTSEKPLFNYLVSS
jgi:hypothetical protein